MRRRMRIVRACGALALALLVAGPAQASGPWSVFTQTGTSAFVGTAACDESSDGSYACDGQFIDVFEGAIKASGEPTFRGQQVCYFEFHEAVDGATGNTIDSHQRSGCTFDAATVTVDGLTSVSLADTVIELAAIDCDPSGCTEPAPAGSTTVSGEWTGFGPIASQKDKHRFSDGLCVQIDQNKGQRREASFVGSIVGGGSIGEGSFTFRTKCAAEHG